MTAPSRETLAGLPGHVVVRDFPETLSAFRACGVDLVEHGGEAVAEAAGAEDATVDTLLDALSAAVEWRARIENGWNGGR